jgi:solute carrier family 25 protein 38
MESSGNSVRHLMAGACSGLMTCVLVQPLDVVKTRMQQPRNHEFSKNEASILNHKQKMDPGLSFVETVRAIHREPRGIRGYWRGTVPTLIRNVPGSSLYFFVLNGIRSTAERLENTSKSLNPSATSQSQSQSSLTASSSSVLPRVSHAVNLAAGSTARVLVGLLMMPFSVVKVRFEVSSSVLCRSDTHIPIICIIQSNLYRYDSVWTAFQSIVRTEGVRGLFSGFGSTTLRDAPFAGLYLLIYEQGKKSLNATAVHQHGSDSGLLERNSGMLVCVTSSSS